MSKKKKNYGKKNSDKATIEQSSDVKNSDVKQTDDSEADNKETEVKESEVKDSEVEEAEVKKAEVKKAEVKKADTEKNGDKKTDVSKDKKNDIKNSEKENDSPRETEAKAKDKDPDEDLVMPVKKSILDMDKNTKSQITTGAKGFILGLFRWVVIIGIAYVIMGPVLGMISRSFFSDADNYNTMVYMIPQSPTLERYKVASTILKYDSTVVRSLIYSITLMIIQVLMCSMAGYGFARYDFPFKKLLFGCVVLMIVIPTHTIMLPLYMTFSNFDVLGILKLTTGSPVNLLSTPVPIYIMTFFSCGLRSGLYIYIFNQFFRGLPKEIEEAAYVDGCGVWYTYFGIMLRNATPAAITVAIFSLVWQYNDTFYARLFNVSDNIVISKRIAGLQLTISNAYKIYDPNILELYMDAGIILLMIPLVIIYVLLQKQFIEGVERSGIVG